MWVRLNGSCVNGFSDKYINCELGNIKLNIKNKFRY